MDQQRLNYLLEQQLANEATPAEQRELTDLLKADPNRESIQALLLEKMQQEEPRMPVMTPAWQNMAERIVQIDKQASPVRSLRPVRLLRWTAAAAAIIAICSGAYLLLNRDGQTPGKNILAVHKRTISTGRGQDVRAILLPDGSQVWLNAASSISFDSAFSDRSVELSGQAFFDVAHVPGSPFVIRSGRLTTTVLGTSFDITAYPDRALLAVAVRTGKVSVQTEKNVPVILESGGQLRLSQDGSIAQHTIDTASIAAWRSGQLMYKDELVSDIIADLQRVFDSNIQIGKEELKKERLTVSFDKSAGLQSALDMICRLTDSKLSYGKGIYSIN